MLCQPVIKSSSSLISAKRPDGRSLLFLTETDMLTDAVRRQHLLQYY
jgi:hypothetical protein